MENSHAPLPPPVCENSGNVPGVGCTIVHLENHRGGVKQNVIEIANKRFPNSLAKFNLHDEKMHVPR